MLSAINTQPNCAGSSRSVKYFGKSTLSIGMYKPVAARSTNASVRKTRFRHTKSKPSMIPAHTPPVSADGSGRPAPSSRRTEIVTIDRPKAPAVTHIVLTPPSVAIIRPPIPGPTMYARLKIASYTLLARSSLQPARVAASGSIVSRAVIPAGSKNAPSAARPASTATLMTSAPNTIASSGTAATDRPESASEIIDTRLRPRKSTAAPAINVAASSGRVPAIATIEASRAEPVRCRTNQGNATIEMPLPAPAIRAANRISINGPRPVVGAWSCVMGYLGECSKAQGGATTGFL